jgi:hypothetical protein
MYVQVDFGFFPENMIRKLGKRVLEGTDKRKIGASFSLQPKDRLIVGCGVEDIASVIEVVQAVIKRAVARKEMEAK